jgi:hypothetical protein
MVWIHGLTDLGTEFKRLIGLEHLNPMQKAMIKLRLDLLDAFVRPSAADIESYFTTGGLVLVDLTDPFLDGRGLPSKLKTHKLI